MKFILSFDLPREMNTARVRIFRKLKKDVAELIHESLWMSSNLESLIKISLEIKRFNGSARILEEKFIF